MEQAPGRDRDWYERFATAVDLLQSRPLRRTAEDPPWPSRPRWHPQDHPDPALQRPPLPPPRVPWRGPPTEHPYPGGRDRYLDSIVRRLTTRRTVLRHRQVGGRYSAAMEDYLASVEEAALREVLRFAGAPLEIELVKDFSAEQVDELVREWETDFLYLEGEHDPPRVWTHIPPPGPPYWDFLSRLDPNVNPSRPSSCNHDPEGPNCMCIMRERERIAKIYRVRLALDETCGFREALNH